MRFKAHELRDRAESLRRMAREATVEREREALTRQKDHSRANSVQTSSRGSRPPRQHARLRRAQFAPSIFDSCEVEGVC
jgi:hypothetical protein